MPIVFNNNIDFDELRREVGYNSLTGDLYSLVTKIRRHVGRTVCRLHRASGYMIVSVKGTPYKAHRLAWLLTYGKWPDNQIDHINGDRGDNRLCNLSEVSHKENSHNAVHLRSSNTSGYRGVSFDKARCLYASELTVDGNKRHLGRFSTPEEASAAYERAKLVYHPTAPSLVL